MVNIANMIDNVTGAFVTLAISGIVVATVFGLDIANGSQLVTDLQTKINDGMVQLAGLVVLIVVILVLRILQQRA